MSSKTCALVLCVIAFSCRADTGLKAELSAYLGSGNSTAIEYLGNGLIMELKKRKSKFKYCLHHEYDKDAPAPIGDQKASHHIIIRCEGFLDLGVRFGLSASGKYRILGYWTLSP
jgi:hypothetical protein